MKKLLVVLLSVLMVASMAACQQKPKALADDTHVAWVAHGNHKLADGTDNSWNGKDTALYEASALKAIALEDVKAISEDLYNVLKDKPVKYLYTTDLLLGTNDAGWSTRCLIDGKLHNANGSYAFKVAQCNAEADGDNKVYSEDLWIPDPHKANAESLTPKTLFIGPWQEEKDENGFDWTANPVAIGGSGLYTVVIAQYTTVSSAKEPGFGIGLVLKESKSGQAYEEIKQWIAGDHTYSLIGDFNSWGGDVEMEKGDGNSWTASVDLTAGQGLKVRADKDWTYSWGKDGGSDNLVVEEDGNYTVTITFNGDPNVVATKN